MEFNVLVEIEKDNQKCVSISYFGGDVCYYFKDKLECVWDFKSPINVFFDKENKLKFNQNS